MTELLIVNSSGNIINLNLEDNGDVNYIEKINLNIKIKKVCAGHFHSVILGENGILYGKGLNITGQLGLKFPKIINNFTKIPNNIFFYDVTLMTRSTIAIDCDGYVYHCGCSKNLNNNNKNWNYKFIKLDTEQIFLEISAELNNLIMIDNQNKIWCLNSRNKRFEKNQFLKKQNFCIYDSKINFKKIFCGICMFTAIDEQDNLWCFLYENKKINTISVKKINIHLYIKKIIYSSKYIVLLDHNGNIWILSYLEFLDGCKKNTVTPNEFISDIYFDKNENLYLNIENNLQLIHKNINGDILHKLIYDDVRLISNNYVNYSKKIKSSMSQILMY